MLNIIVKIELRKINEECVKKRRRNKLFHNYCMYVLFCTATCFELLTLLLY